MIAKIGNRDSMPMNAIEFLFTALLITVAITVVVRYVTRALRVQEPDCGCCETCPGHTPQGCCAARRGAGK